MITCHKDFLLTRCMERGYVLEEVMPCVSSMDGDMWTVDTQHPAYPANARVWMGRGPGTELKQQLLALGFAASEQCKCSERARLMDKNEFETPGWCETNIDTIVGWLREEAEKRGLPFLDVVGRLLVRRAIRNARRAASNAGNTVS
jgi:hypothetical protein